MSLKPVGATTVKPETMFFWDDELQTTVELTVLEPESGDNRFLVRMSKTYRLLKQDPDGRESWHTKLAELNTYLREAFSSFRISADYTRSVNGSISGITDDAEVLGEDAVELVATRKQLVEQLESTRTKLRQIEQSVLSNSEHMQERLAGRDEQLSTELEAVNQEIESLTEHLYRKRTELQEWEEYGAALAYLFTVSTEGSLVSPDEVEHVLEAQQDRIRTKFYHSVGQIFDRNDDFQLAFEEMEEPRVFNRLEHTSLLNPNNLESLQEQHPDYEEALSEISEQSIRQYESYAAYDLETEAGVFEYSNATPAQAVNSVIQQLEVGKVASGANAPNDGPYVGNVVGTQQAVGFDPADPTNGMAHLYIAGKSGSGKSFLKRVLLENVASLGYDILSITPSDTESIGASFPNPDHDDGQGITAEQYWVGNDKLLEEPDNVNDLFTGINIVTLKDLPDSEKQGFVDRVFSALYEMDGLERPLFVFLEEAHNFDSGAAAEAIQDIVRESRKHGIHVVLVSQSPTDFSHSQKHIRENTSTVFMQGEYTSYADKFSFLDKSEITGLGTGQAIFASRDFPKTYIDVREPLTLAVKPDSKQIEDLDEKYSAESPDLDSVTENRVEEIEKNESTQSGDSKVEIDDEEKQLLGFIKQYIRDKDQTPTYSKCHREGPYGTKKTRKTLDSLERTDNLEKETVVRGGQETEAFKPI